jgi:hypothetical protein
MLSLTTLPLLLLAATHVSAFGCETHTFTQCADNIVHWYDPDDGQICDPLDCGGGRAPPKTDVPCCGNYQGTEACVDTPSYLPCFASMGKSTTMETIAEPTTTADVTTTSAEESGPIETTEASQSTSTVVAGPTTSASESQSGSAVVSTTQPPVSGATTSSRIPGGNSTVLVPSGSGNATLSPTSGPPVATQTGNMANGVRYDALLAIAGALVALV